MKKTLRDHLTARKKTTAPVARLLGMQIIRQGSGGAVVRMTARKTHLNTIGTVHGGILCDLSDAAMGYAFTTLLAKRRVGMTVELKINFLKPAYASDRLTAWARVLSHGKTLCYVECTVLNHCGDLVARAGSTCKIL